MNKQLTCCWVFFLALALSACQTLPQSSNGDFEVFRYDDFIRQYQQAAIYDSWKLKGTFSFVNNNENIQGKVFWDQTEQQSQIQLLGPLGAGSVKLTIEPNVASLRQGQKIYRAPSVDELMRQVLGWKMPLQALNYWLFGLADPNQKARYRIDAEGDIEELHQSGWVIHFKQYRQVAGFTMLMPRKIFASHASTDTGIKMVVAKMLHNES